MFFDKFCAYCAFFTIIISNGVSAKLYHDYEITGVDNVVVTQAHAQSFFTSPTPQAYIEKLIQTEQNKGNHLLLENFLYQLLGEVSFQVQQDYLSEYVNLMLSYQPKAKKLSQEGGMVVPVYNIPVRAKGVLNAWLAVDSLRYYQLGFENNPEGIMRELSNEEIKYSRPKFLGLKNSIASMSQETIAFVRNYILSSNSHNINLDRFVAYFALITKNKNVAQFALKTIDKSSQQILLKNLATNFAKPFVIEQLLSSVKEGENAKLAFSLLSPYVNEDNRVQEFSINALSNKKLATSAAFVLSHSNNTKLINRLGREYQSNKSQFVKQNIMLSFNINESADAKIMMDSLKHGELK